MGVSSKTRKAWKIANKQAMVDYKGGDCFNCGDANIDHLMIVNAGSRHYPERTPYLIYEPEYGSSWNSVMNIIGQPEASLICARCYEEAQAMWNKGLIPFP